MLNSRPARTRRSEFGGTSQTTLSRTCRCPNWVRHESLQGKSKTERAAAYPKPLCDAIAKLVVEVFKKSLALEFWRYQVRMKVLRGFQPAAKRAY